MGRIGCVSETPILDLEDDPPPLNLHWINFWIVVGLGVATLRWITIDPWGWFPVLFVSLAVHEMGHAAAAKLMGSNCTRLQSSGFRFSDRAGHGRRTGDGDGGSSFARFSPAGTPRS